MIIFDLSCKQEHPFEGWFQSLSSYDNQIEAGLISCPHCGSTEIRRVPSVVHMSKPAKSAHPTEPKNSSDPARHAGTPGSSTGLPATRTQAEMFAAFEQLMSSIVSNSEDVGQNFAEEARRIHYLEAPVRSILGEASDEEYESLLDEGIEVLRLPIVKKSIN